MNSQAPGAPAPEVSEKPDVCRPSGTAELPMLDIYMPMMKSSAIVAAVRLGLFEALADQPLDAAALAQKTGARPTGIETLADFLVSLGFLELVPSDTPSPARQTVAERLPAESATTTPAAPAEIPTRRYANSASTRRWFTSAGQVDYSAGALWNFEAWAMMGELDKAVRDGKPATTLWERMNTEPHLGPLFSRYMNAFARHVGPDLVTHVPVAQNQTRLLDLGGSHGLHSIGLCRAHPQLNAVIVDLPVALKDTPATIAQAGLQDRISLRPGNLLDLAWAQEHDGGRKDTTPDTPDAARGDSGGFDLALYLCVAHNQTANDNARVIRQIAKVLRPGGLLVIHDYLATEPLNAFHAAFRLTLLYETGTRTYSEQEFRTWLAEAGFTSVQRIDLNPLEKGSILLARL